MELPNEWLEFLSLLQRHDAKFVIVGAYAMAVHGRPRASQDIDGVPFARAYAGALQERLGGLDLRFLGLTDFVATKKASGRTKDLLDIELLKESGLWDDD